MCACVDDFEIGSEVTVTDFKEDGAYCIAISQEYRNARRQCASGRIEEVHLGYPGDVCLVRIDADTVAAYWTDELSLVP